MASYTRMIGSVAQLLDIDTDRCLTYDNSRIEYQNARISRKSQGTTTGVSPNQTPQIPTKITNERIRKVDEVIGLGLGPDVMSLFEDMVDDCEVHIKAKDSVVAYTFNELVDTVNSMDHQDKITKLVIYSRLEINEGNREEYSKVFEVVETIESNDNVVSCIGDMRELFAHSCIKTIKGNWDTSNVTSMNGMFELATQFQGGGISGWDTVNVKDMSWTFKDATAFNEDISDWNTTNVTDMRGMYKGATAFNRTLNWDTGNVEIMTGMFWEALAFNGDISSWNTRNVVDMQSMFHGAEEFNQDLTQWATQKVVTMACMFREAKTFNGDISGWNTSNVSDMSEMFWDAKSFNRDISTRDTNGGTFWNTREVTYMHDMFRGAKAFNQPLNWDTKNVTDMSSMFHGATVFNQDISTWTILDGTDTDSIFEGADRVEPNHIPLTLRQTNNA
jgi:surface protein